MSDFDLFDAVAKKNGEDSHEIRRRGFMLEDSHDLVRASIMTPTVSST